jgi:hypothetical protein
MMFASMKAVPVAPATKVLEQQPAPLAAETTMKALRGD